MQVSHISVLCYTIPRSRTPKKYKHRVSSQGACWDLQSPFGIYSRPGIPRRFSAIWIANSCQNVLTRFLDFSMFASLQILGIQPRCNGLVEKFNSTLKAMLKQPHRYLETSYYLFIKRYRLGFRHSNYYIA